ncbi:MAG: DUF1778 domain-containing protein [Acidobacteriota bacterium]
MATAAKPLKSERLEASVPVELKRIFVRAAELRGQSLTDFVLITVTEAAERTIREPCLESSRSARSSNRR